MNALQTIAAHANRPISSNTLGSQIHRTVTDLFGTVGLAITLRGVDDRLALVSLIDAQGNEHIPMPLDLTTAPEGGGSIEALGANTWSPAKTVEYAGAPELATVFEQVRRMARVPWELGGYFEFDFLLLADSDTDGEITEAQQLQLNLLATSLFRKAERAELIRAEGWIKGELQQIARLQELLRPDHLDTIAGAEFAIFTQAFRLAGGDYYDVSKLTNRAPDDRRPEAGDVFSLGIADVSGHGPAAAVEAAMLDAILRTFPGSREVMDNPGSHTVATYLNRYMFTRKPRPSFVTGLFCSFNPFDRMLRHTCAGHPPPLWRRAGHDGCIELPVNQEIPLRVLRDYEWSLTETRLEVGDIVVFYTDGVTEARAPDGSQFGIQRFMQAVSKPASAPYDMLANIRADLSAHIGNAEIGDDQTIIVVQYN